MIQVCKQQSASPWGDTGCSWDKTPLWKSASLENIFICLSCVKSWILNISHFKLSELWRIRETSRAITCAPAIHRCYHLSHHSTEQPSPVTLKLPIPPERHRAPFSWSGGNFSKPQIRLIFSCLSSYIYNPQWFQHQYQTAQAFIFQFAVESNTSSWQPLLHGHLSAV